MQKLHCCESLPGTYQYWHAGLESLANAVVDVWKTQLDREAAAGLQLQDAMLLTCIGYWLAVGQGLQEQQDVNSVAYSPWLPDQESAVKVNFHCLCLLLTSSNPLHHMQQAYKPQVVLTTIQKWKLAR